ncbi:hypothetical protein SLS57_006536 [Botryosphaeria dothidea]
MYLSTLFASFFALTAYALPLSARETSDVKCVNPGDCYRISEVSIDTPNGRPGSDNQVHLWFTLWDDSPKISASTTCSASWEAGSNGWPNKSIKCDDDNFRWSFSKFESVTEWNIEATHDFIMDAKWGARSFANGTAATDDFECDADDTGAKHCSLKETRVINLGIYAMIA